MNHTTGAQRKNKRYDAIWEKAARLKAEGEKTAAILHCEMSDTCMEPVTHLDEHGFIYCAPHGFMRRYSMRCRKLRPHELRRLESGNPIRAYR